VRAAPGADVIHRRTWKTREAVELATLIWVSRFNNHRLMGSLGYIQPASAKPRVAHHYGLDGFKS
jgi:transposase InsO family protein